MMVIVVPTASAVRSIQEAGGRHRFADGGSAGGAVGVPPASFGSVVIVVRFRATQRSFPVNDSRALRVGLQNFWFCKATKPPGWQCEKLI
jgi:hypothetical protein